MGLDPDMVTRLRVAAEQEADAHESVVALVVAAREAGGTLREIGDAIGRSHTDVGRIERRARAGAL
jgi:hypothetical protein